MFSLKNKKQNKAVFVLALFLFSSGVFLLMPMQAYAGALDTVTGMFSSVMDSTLGLVFRALLYAVFVVLGWLTSAAVTLFEWAINPDYISGPSGLLNKENVYVSWKFIRDFFNLFFILTLLYTAFTIVFQVAKDYKKTLLSLVLAALFVNFSFPITRVIIDATNVPMYYFVNQIAAKQEGKSAFGNFLGASQIQEALIPKDYSVASGSTQQLLMAIVMLFLFMISLLVLAVLMVVRLVALVILLIFASVGFAAAVIPGMKEYSDKWWKALWQYALFGPASMLMLLIATRFFTEIGNDSTKAQFLSMATKNSSENTGLIASMAMFSIPVIMMWFAISLGTSMSIAGAGAVVGKGKEIAKWAGRKTYNNPVGRGLYGGAKKAVMEGKVPFLGKYGAYGKIPGVGKLSTGDFWASPSKTEATIKGGVAGGWGGGAKERVKIHQQAVNKAVKENKENQVSDSAHIKNLASSDRVEREAAALSLAENKGIRNAETLASAVKAVGDNQDAVLKILDGAKPEAIQDMTAERHSTVMDSFYEKDEKTGEFKKDDKGNRIVSGKTKDAHDAYNSKLKKEGQLKIRVDYEINQKVAGGVDVATARTETYSSLIRNLSSDDLAKQGSIHSGLKDDEPLKAYLKERVEKDLNYYQEAYKKMSEADREKWTAAGMFPKREQPRTDEGEKIRPRIAAIKNEHGKES